MSKVNYIELVKKQNRKIKETAAQFTPDKTLYGRRVIVKDGNDKVLVKGKLEAILSAHRWKVAGTVYDIADTDSIEIPKSASEAITIYNAEAV